MFQDFILITYKMSDFGGFFLFVLVLVKMSKVVQRSQKQKRFDAADLISD